MPVPSARNRTSSPDRDAEPAGTVSALERGIAVLRCFREDVRSLSNAELAAMTGIPKPTVTRLAATLVAQGLMRQEADTERFSLAAGVVALAHAFLSGVDARSIARPHMAALADATEGSVYLAVREGLDMILIETAAPQAAVVLARLRVGSHCSVASSALGRAHFSAITDKLESDRLLAKMKESLGEDEWVRLERGFERSQRESRTQGYCLSAGEFHRGINAVAVPLVVPGGEIMALNCGGPAYDFTEKRLRNEVAPRLIEAACAIASELGGFVPLPAKLRNVSCVS
jgi:DNA-binding IclR family transcriptional regulator